MLLLPFTRNEGEYDHGTQSAIVRAKKVAQPSLLDKAQTSWDGGAAHVQLVTANFKAVGFERVKYKIRQQAHCLCNVAVTFGGDAYPVANFKVTYIPIAWVKSGSTEIAMSRSLPHAQSHVLAKQPRGDLVDNPVAGFLNRLVLISKREPGAQVVARFRHSLEDILRIAFTIWPDDNAFATQFFKHRDEGAKLCSTHLVQQPKCVSTQSFP